MTDAEYPAFAEALGHCSVAFSRDLDTPTIDLFFKALKDIPWHLVRHAAADIIKHEERWVPPARWRKVVDKVSERMTEAEQQQIEQASRKLLPPPLWDPITSTYVETFQCFTCHDTGWRPACGCPKSKIVTLLNTDLVDLKSLGHCLDHGGHAANGLLYAQPVKPCDCRNSNPEYLKNHPKSATKFSRPKPVRRRRADGE